MAHGLWCGFAMCLVASAAASQPDFTLPPDSRTVLGGGDHYLSAGADAIRAQQYDDGIRLTNLGLQRSPTKQNRAAALSNLCAAHAAKGEADLAITYCTESLAINANNWRAFSNRSYALYLKGHYVQANLDLEAATKINPSPRQLRVIRGMINERSYRPSVIMEDH